MNERQFVETERKCKEMSSKNYAYFLQNLELLLTEHSEKFVVIHDCSISSIHDSFENALDEALKRYALGTFIIQQCIHQENSMNTFCSNNVCFVGCE